MARKTKWLGGKIMSCHHRADYCQPYQCYLERLYACGLSRRRLDDGRTVVHLGRLSHTEYHLVHQRADEVLGEMRCTHDMAMSDFILARIYWLLALPVAPQQR